MAIVVPFLLSSTAVGTAIGLTGSIAAGIGGAIGMSAGLVSTIASVAFQVTGVNDKINKAASKVFGEDLVGFANLAGAAYGAFNGGFDIGGSSDVATAGASLSKAALDGTTDFGLNSAQGAYDVATGASGLADAAVGLAGESLSKSALDGTNALGANSTPNSFNLAEQAGVAPDAASGTNLIAPDKPLGLDVKPPTSATGATDGLKQAAATQPGAAGVDAAGANAASNKYSLAPQGNASAPVSSSGLGVRPPASLQPPAPTGFGAKAGSFFDKLLNNEKAMGMAIQGLGQGLTAAQAGKAQQEALDWQKKRYTATGNFRVVQ